MTYGAGGSTRDRTRDVVTHIERDTVDDGDGAPHLRLPHVAELEDVVVDFPDAGIENILALAGDPPDATAPTHRRRRLVHALELVELVREVGDFSIGVAAHPELHPRSPDRASDRRYLADKLAEADFAITQFFFEVDPYSG